MKGERSGGVSSRCDECMRPCHDSPLCKANISSSWPRSWDVWLAGWLPRSCSTLMLLLLLLLLGLLFADYHSISPYEGDEGNVFEGDDDEGPRANAGRG